MKFKYYLRGAGVGIFVTTLVFIIALAFGANTMSDKEVVKRAKELGMVEADSAGDETLQETIDREKAEKAKDNTEDASEKNTTAKDKVTTKNKIGFSIVAGQGSYTIAKNMQDAGIIKDADDFNDFLTENNYDNGICTGSFYATDDMTYEELAKLITNSENRVTTPQ